MITKFVGNHLQVPGNRFTTSPWLVVVYKLVESQVK